MGEMIHTKADKKELQNAENLWVAFLKVSKWTVIVSAGVLILLALIFV